MPNFSGEIGLNTDIYQLAHKVFALTENINVGSAIMNLLSNGGPIARAEQTLSFLAMHGANPQEKRKLNLGFASGRFPYQIAPYGIKPRDEFEKVVWPILKGKIFSQATEIFLRLVKGEEFSGEAFSEIIIKEEDFRDSESLEKAKNAYKPEYTGEFKVKGFYEFDNLKIAPNDFDSNLIDFYMGSHDPKVVELANKYAPCKVFNLSITPAHVIEKTHETMSKVFHKDGGPWKRSMMPRTVMVFLSDEKELSKEENDLKARQMGLKAMEGYWKAMAGTVDKSKIESAVDNTLCGSPETIAQKIKDNYHPEDRIMLWFDFNNHNNQQVCSMMKAFKNRVMPLLEV